MTECDKSQQVQILLEEYRTLREEVIKRMELGVNSTSWFGIISSVILGIGIQYDVKPVFVLLPFIIAVLVSVDMSSRTNIMFLGTHLAALERRINRILEKDLLLWEHTLPFARVGSDLKLFNPCNSKSLLNPLFCRYPMICIVVILVYGYSVYAGFTHLIKDYEPAIWAWLFGVITILMFFYLGIMSYIGVKKLPKFYEELITTEWQSKNI